MKDIPKSIGFIYSNQGKHHLMEYYVLTVNDVEIQTGIDFFYTLPDIIEEEIESQTNLTNWWLMNTNHSYESLMLYVCV